MQRKVTDGGKIWQNIYLVRGLYPAYMKISQNLTKKEATQLKLSKRFKQTHDQKDIWVANGPINRCSTSIVVMEMQIKNTVRYHYIIIRWLKFEKMTISITGNYQSNWDFNLLLMRL